MESLGDAYAPAIALEGWNYVQYLGPFAKPQAEPVFLCVNQGRLVVATGREPSKLWSVNRLRAADDDVNRHACAFKRGGTQTYIAYRISPSDGSAEIGLGPQARFDVHRIARMKKPCYIRVNQAPASKGDCPSSSEVVNDAQVAGPSDLAAATSTAITAGAKAVEWYLGISSDLKVVLKPFPPMSECSAEMASRRPIWELTTPDEAIDQDCPWTEVPTRDASKKNNPMYKEFYLQPDRFKKYDRDFWPS